MTILSGKIMPRILEVQQQQQKCVYSRVAIVQFPNHFWPFETPCTIAWQGSLSFTISWRLLKLMFTELVLPSNHLIFCHPLLHLPSIFPSIRVFSSESVLCIRWPEYWSFSFSISPANEYWGLISYRIDWFDLLAVWGILKSLLQHHIFMASVLRRSAFLIVQFSHPYMTTWKSHSFEYMDLCRQSNVSTADRTM